MNTNNQVNKAAKKQQNTKKQSKNKKEVIEEFGYNVETPAINKSVEAYEQIILPEKFNPENWDMTNDVLIKLYDDIKFLEDRMVVKNNGFKSYSNEPIGESSVEPVEVRSNFKFGEVVHPGANKLLVKGDEIVTGINSIKIVDFDKMFAVVPNFAIYGKINGSKNRPSKPSRKNIFGRFLQGLLNRMGLRNVYKQK